jgi:hypothetical protein
MIIPDITTYAIYTEFDEKVKGGFVTMDAAWKHLSKYLPLYIYDKDTMELLGIAANDHEAKLIQGNRADYTIIEQGALNEYRVLLEIDDSVDTLCEAYNFEFPYNKDGIKARSSIDD